MRKIIIAFALALLLLSGCAARYTEAEPDPTGSDANSSPSAVPTMKAYSAVDGRLSISIPEDWEMQDKSEGGLSVLSWTSPEFNVIVGAGGGSQAGMDKSAFIAAYINDLKSKLSNSAVLSDSEISIDGVDGVKYRISDSGSATGGFYPYTVILLFDGDSYYAISFIVQAEGLETYRETLDNIEASISLNEVG